MIFFFDDSGDFSSPSGTKHKISLWIGILIPENCIERIENKFKEWEGITQPREKERGEVKGSLLKMETRKLFFDFIENEPDLLIYPTIIDLQIQKKYAPPLTSKGMRDYGMDASEKIKSKQLKDQTILHSKRIGNLSNEQLLKLMTLTTCVIDTLRYSILFKCYPILEQFWNKVNIWVDMSSVRRNTREEQVFRESLGWMLYNYTKRRPFELIKEVHNKDHPFIKNFDTPRGINGRKLFRNLYFETSKNHWGLRFIDIIANTLYKALYDLSNTKGMLPFYKKIMKHNILGPKSNLGFVYFPSDQSLSDQIIASKYAILQQIIASI